MSADLHLRAIPAVRVDLVREWAFVEASDYDVPAGYPGVSVDEDGYLHDPVLPEWRGVYEDRSHAALNAVLEMPDLWIGQVSWAKASDGGDYDRYVPAPVARIYEIVGPGRLLTSGVAGSIKAAMNLPDHSMYTGTRWRRVPADEAARRRELARRGREHKWAYERFVEPDFVVYRSRGLAKRQHVKRWLEENHGSYVVTMTV